jgi:hypothetical protein
MRVHRLVQASIVGAALLLMSGCSATAPYGLEALSREQVPADELPSVLVEAAIVTESSARLLETHEGVAYYAAQSSSNKDDVCFFVYQTDDAWASGCSSALPIELGLNGLPNAVLTGSPIDSDKYKSIGENVSIAVN